MNELVQQKTLAQGLAIALAVWQGKDYIERNMTRASGECICDFCGLDFYHHPKVDGLHITCQKGWVKP